MRIGVAGIFHESNTFAPGLTDLSKFKIEWVLEEDQFYSIYENTLTGVGGLIDLAKEENYEFVPIFTTRAIPSGTVSAEALDEMISVLIQQLEKEADSLDGLVLLLHGAMVSENHQDVEGKILQEVRKCFGSKPIATTLDLHVNMSDAMVQHSDILTAFDTYPHIDMYERAQEACRLLLSLIRGEIKPVHYLGRPNLLVAPPAMDTNVGPFKAFMDKVFEYEKDPEVLNVLAAGGFPYSDVEFAGVTITVTTNNNPAKAEQVATELSDWFWEHREDFKAQPVSVEQALKMVEETKAYPTVFIESSDNVGGGGPADATHVLKSLIDNKQDHFLIKICDPQAVKEAHRLGVNGQFDMEVGGKTDRAEGREALHGDPVRIQGRIRILGDGSFIHRGKHNTGKKASMGLTAVIELADCPHSVVVLTEGRASVRDIDQVSSIGLDPTDFKIIVVKAAIAWKTAFGDIAKQAIEVDTPGCCSSNLNHFTFVNVPSTTTILSPTTT